MNQCPNFSSVLIGTKKSTKILSRLRCKQWSCEYCAVQNSMQWRGHLLNTISTKSESGEFCSQWWFATITASAGNRTSQGSASALQRHWQAIIQLFRDKSKPHNHKVSYVRVFEAHQDGAIHLHAIINCPVDVRSWETNQKIKSGKNAGKRKKIRFKDYIAKKAGLGFICDIEPIEPYAGYHPIAVTVKYITKYMTKSAQNFELPKHARRIITSRNLSKKEHPEKSEYTWKLHSDFDEKSFWYEMRDGVMIYDVQNKKTVTYDDFDENGKLL